MSRRASPWRRRARIGLSVLLVILGGMALLGWHQRDLPRRRVETMLAEELGARVELARLEILGVERFLLRDVVVREMSARPWLARLSADRILVHGSVREILRGNYRDVQLSGLVVVLSPSDVETVPAEPAAVRVDRLEIEHGRLIVDAGGGRVELDLTARLREIGGGMQGEVGLTSPGFFLSPIAALLGNPGGMEPRGSVEGFEARLRFTDDRVELTARSRGSSIETETGRIELPGVAVDATAAWQDDGRILLDLDPELPGVESASISAVLAANGVLQRGEAELKGLDLETVSAFLLPLPTGGLLIGRADLKLVSPRAEQVDFTLRTDVSRWLHPGASLRIGAERIAATATGTFDLGRGPHEPRSVTYEVHARARGVSGRSDGVDLAADDLELEFSGKTAFPSLYTSFSGGGTIGPLSGWIDRLELSPALAALGFRLSGEAGGGKLVGRLGVDGAELGRAEIDGTISFAPPATGVLDWNWQGADLGRLFAFARDRGVGLPAWMVARGRFDASGRASGELRAPAIRGEIALESLSLGPNLPEDWSFADGSARLSFDWPDVAGPVDVSPVDLQGALCVGPLETVALSLHGSARVDPHGGTAELLLPQVDLQDLARVEVVGRWDREERAARIEIGLADVELARWRPFLRPLIGDPLPGFEIEGALRADLEGRWDPDRGLRGTGTASLTGNSLAHEDGTRVIEGLDMRWKLSFGNDAHDRSAWLDANVPVGGFLVLWGQLFGDYSTFDGRLNLHVEKGGSDSGWRGTARLALDDTTELHAALRAAPAEPLAYEVGLNVANLGEAFRRWVHDPLSDSIPVLQRMEAGGSLVASLGGRLSRTERTIEGRVGVENGRLEGTLGRVFVRGLQLELPVDLRFHGAVPEEHELDRGRSRRGRLEFERMGFGGVEFEQTATDLFVRADSVGLDEGLAMPFLGGVLVFEELTVSGILRPSPRMESGLLLSGIQLDVLSESLGLVPLEGTAEGYFPQVSLAQGRLEVEGDGEFSVFGGRLTVHDISGENLLSRFPKLTFSADFGDIDLLQVTHTFDFGDMSGILEGDITNCELFRWTPVRFGARFETVARKGVPQTINVKAIDNIAILGSGGASPGMLDRGLHRFLDRYTYRKLGVTMTLDNDLFVLRGLERRGSRELFLKGKLPFPIEVVNVQPGRAIGFRSMLQRVKRLDFSGMTTDRPQVVN